MECLEFPHTRYSEFRNRLAKKAIFLSIPICGALELTSLCNFKCSYCYVIKDKNKKELTYNEITKIIDEAVAHQTLWLTLTGGEPLLNPNFLRIYDYIIKSGILVTIFTNGVLFNKEIISHMKKYPPAGMEITLYGSTDKTYENFTGTKNSFKKVIKNIKLLIKNKAVLQLRIKAVINSLNKNEISDIMNIARYYKLGLRLDGKIFPRLDGSRYPLKYRLSPEELVQLELSYPSFIDEYKKMMQKDKDAAQNKFQEKDVFSCLAGRASFYIDSTGKMRLCALISEPSFDIKKIGFSKAWNQMNRYVKNLKWKDSNCANCKDRNLCKCCPAVSYSEHKRFDKPVEYFCKAAKLRKEKICSLSK